MARVLVAYASKRGSTAEIADAIAATLREAGDTVDCVEVGAVPALDGYHAVVLGSAVYMRRWRGDARRFLRKHRRELARLPLWVFSSGPTGDPANDDDAWTEPAHTIRKAEEVGARDHVVFGGRVPIEPHGFAQRAMVDNTPAEWRDRRDWDAIRAWARGIAADLHAGRAAA
ncbi:MAG TPA: flavodoxin domain-containing protein [Conexibacter sp.]|nr:flavodoxin domain-containing protein [Conexibacter sp.]